MKLLALPLSLCLALGALACGPGGNSPTDDAQPAPSTLTVAPADVMLEVVNGAAVTQP